MSNDAMTEKVSVNINTATLSCVDMLVDRGYYSNRSDFINQALREKLQAQQATVERLAAEEKRGGRQWFLGVQTLTAEAVKALSEDGEPLRLTGYGLLKIDADIPEDALFSAVESIRVKGRVICRESVRRHYGL